MPKTVATHRLPRLTWLERWALKLLHRSPRVGLVIVKPCDTTLMSVSARQDDPMSCVIAQDLLYMAKGEEAPSLQLERIYHQPAFGDYE